MTPPVPLPTGQTPAPDQPKRPKQCEALRKGKRCPNDAQCYWAHFGRWVCTTHILSSTTTIQFVPQGSPE